MFEKLETLNSTITTPTPTLNRSNQVTVEEQEPPPPSSPPVAQTSNSIISSPSPTSLEVKSNDPQSLLNDEKENPSTKETIEQANNHNNNKPEQSTLTKPDEAASTTNETNELLSTTTITSTTTTTTTTTNATKKQSNITNKLTNSTNQHNNYQYISSVKKSAITSLNLCSGLKRLKKKARLLGNQNFYTNKYLNNKYASYSSSSPSSASSSASSCSESNQIHNNNSNNTTTNFTTLTSQPLVEPSLSSATTNENKTPAKQKNPMKLHKFYHSVPFKCPFCFTFKENPSDFINHLATVHYSDVKILYERRSHKLMSKRADENEENEIEEDVENCKQQQDERIEVNVKQVENEDEDEDDLDEEDGEVDEEEEGEDEEEDEEDLNKKDNNTLSSTNSSMQQENTIKTTEDISANLLSPPSSLSSKLGYSLPPRKQQRLLKSPLNQSILENTQSATVASAISTTTSLQAPTSSDLASKPIGDITTNLDNQNYFNFYCKSNSKHLHPISHHHHFQKSMHKSASNQPINNNINNNNNNISNNKQEFLLPSSPSYLSQDKKHLLESQARLQNSANTNGKNLLLNTAFASILNHQNHLMKSFAGSNQFENNSNNHHNQFQQQQQQPNINNLSNEASMKCAICDRGFEYYSNLRRHIKTKHKIFGKQVKEYVIRHNFNSNTSSSSSSSSNTSTSQLMQRQSLSKHNSDDLKSDSQSINNQQNDMNICTSLASSPSSAQLNNLVISNNNSDTQQQLNNKSKFANNSDQIHHHVNGILSPSSSSSSTLLSNKTSNYQDNKSLNGKNSPLSSISSSSIGSSKSFTPHLKLDDNVQQQMNALTNEHHQIKNESLDDEMDQDEIGSSTGSSSSTSSSPVASILQPSSLLYSPSSSSTNTTTTNATPQISTSIPSAPKAAYSNNLNSTVAAIAAAAAAAAASGMNSSNDLNSSLMAAAAANTLVPPHLNMASLFTNHANATMSKIKSSLLESLLSRKMPNKYLGTDMSSIAAAAAAASSVMPQLTNDYLSQMTNDLTKKDSKMANLNKLLQNIVEINQFNHQQQQQLPFNNLNDQEKSILFNFQNQFKLNSLNQFKSNDFNQQQEVVDSATHDYNHQCTKPDCNCLNSHKEQECNDLDLVSSTNKSSLSSSSNDLDDSNENNNIINSIDMKNKKRRYCHSYNQSSYSQQHHHQQQQQTKTSIDDQDADNYDDDLVINQTDSNEDQQIGQDDQQNNFYEDVESELDEERDLNETNNQNTSSANGQNNEAYEDELRTRSRSSSSSSTSSNSSKSACSSSLSSMLMNQIASSAATASSQSNKLLLNGLVNCMNQPQMNQSAFESLKQLSQRNNILGIGGQANHHHHHHHHNHFNDMHHQTNRRNSYQQRHVDEPNMNTNKRKKSKDLGLNGNFSNLANNPQSIAAAIRSLQCSPNDTSSLEQSRLDATSPSSMMLSLTSNMNSSNSNNNNNQNNQIRYSSEIWRCPYCCYETTSASRYNSHLVCHGWKPYLCPHCGSRSNRLPDMRTHISTFHPEFNVNTFVVLSEEEAKSTLKDYMKNRALINRKLKEMRPQPKFKCKLCPYASLYQFNLTKHVKSVHLSDIYNNKTNNSNTNDSKSNQMTNNSDNAISCNDS